MAVIDAPAQPNRRAGRPSERIRPAAAPPASTPAGPGFKALHGILILALLGYAVALVLGGQNANYPAWLGGWGVDAFELLCSLLVVARGVLSARDRRYALLLGAAGCLWAFGDFAMTAETLGGATPATLSLANYLWAGFFPLAYVAVMVLMQRDVKKLTAANYLDGVVATLVTAAALVAFAFHAIAKVSGAGTDGAAVNLVYPVGDLLLFGLTALGVAMLPPGRRARWYLIALAGLVNAAGDIAALFNGLVATNVGWFLNTMAWPTSLLLISCAVWLAPSPGVAVKENTSSGFKIPAIASAMALVILFVGSLEHTSRVAIGFASATLLAAGIRFGLALRRMNELTHERHRELETAAEAERESKRALEISVRNYAQFAARVADGDLTATASSDGEDMRELADSLNSMVMGLAEISGEIQDGVNEIGASTAEILGSVSRHTENAGHQSAAITQTSATINELRQAADTTSQRAHDVAQQASHSVRISDEGTRAVAAIAEAMEEIRRRAAAVSEEIDKLSARAQQIGEITDTVNELADRSNLLALNATIEAARAGEAGRGFAVVADQVRQLADQSKAATAKVEMILKEVKVATSAAVSASDAGARVVEHGLELTARADEGIRSLTEVIRGASNAAEEIAASAQQQSVGMDEIAGSMNSIENGTTQFLAGAEASHFAAQNLNELAAKLARLTERYRVATA